MKDEEMCWANLAYHINKIHGNERRTFDNVKVKIIDKNGAVIEESQKVLFKQELNEKGNKYINTYLEVYIK